MPALFGILLSALNTALAFFVRSVFVKFITFFALFFVVKEFVAYMVGANLFPGATHASALSSSLGSLPSGVWYFLDLIGAANGLSAILSAHATRFIIRRIPVIG